MNKKLTYIEARDKIWAAYFRDEIEPMSNTFCFCGTLNGGDGWNGDHYRKDEPYSYREFKKMECGLLDSFNTSPVVINTNKKDPLYEEKIFAGMLAALEVLKSIHKSRGEVIPEDEPLLTKRKAANELLVERSVATRMP